MKNRSLKLFLAILAFAVSAFAQLATNTSIVGKAVDATGAALSDAQVTLRNQETSETFTAHTSEAGTYEFQFLKAGVYTVTVQKSGFSTTSQRDVNVSANQTVRADFTVAIGSVDTRIEVTADI